MNWKKGHNVHCSWEQPIYPLTDECVQKLWYIYTMEHYSAITKEHIWVSTMRWMNLEPTIQSKVNQKKNNKMYINACMWNLERWCWWTYLQGSNRDTDIQNRLVDTVGKGEGGMNWENSMETDITICKIDSKWELVVWYRELNPLFCDKLEGKDGREVPEGGDVCIL